MLPTLFVATLLAAPAAEKAAPAPPPRPSPARWEKNVAAIEKRLAASPPKPGGVAFAGSSSIVRWDLEKSFPGKGYVNVGFGGSIISDSAHYAPRLFGTLKPATVVFYAGDNDVGGGRSPEQLASDFREFVDALRREAPGCKVIFVSVKPSLSRWKQFETQKKANALIRAYCEGGDGLTYLDVVTDMLGADGTPRPELFVKDGLHMSPAGYEIWAAKVGALLGK